MKWNEGPAWGQYSLTGLRRWILNLSQKVPFKRLGIWVRSPLKNSLSGYVDTEIWGLRLRLMSTGNLSEQRMLFLPQHVDSRERQILAKELSSGGRFLDVGANAGLYSLWVASLGHAKTVVEAFEPDSNLRERLDWNLQENKLSRVNVWNCALGRMDGETKLQSNSDNLGQNRVGNKEEGVVVPMRRLASIFSEEGWDDVQAMKIDVEGYEVEVLEDFFESVAKEKWPKLVICEDLEKGASSPGSQLLEQVGYHKAERTRMNGIFRLTSEEEK